MEQPQNTELEEEEGEELECTCKDSEGNPLEFITAFCPVCHVEKEEPGYEGKELIVTDADLMSQTPINWTGHPFKCSKCGWMQMHDMKHCPGCGVKLVVQSNVVTVYVREMAKKYEKT